jgi:hypothetical protein
MNFTVARYEIIRKCILTRILTMNLGVGTVVWMALKNPCGVNSGITEASAKLETAVLLMKRDSGYSPKDLLLELARQNFDNNFGVELRAIMNSDDPDIVKAVKLATNELALRTTFRYMYQFGTSRDWQIYITTHCIASFFLVALITRILH